MAMLYRALRALVSLLAALVVFLAGAVGVALITMAFDEPASGDGRLAA
jgi:hypothetical protein